MERSVLRKMLDQAPGVEGADGSYTVAEEHRASLYLGLASTTSVVAGVVRITLQDDFVETEAKDGTRSYFPYDPVIGFALRPPPNSSSRTGF